MPLRDRILRESSSLVADRGLEALSIRAVAQRCHVSIGAVQHHFPSKTTLLIALVDGIGDDLTPVLAEPDPHTTPADAVTRLTLVAEFLGGAVDDAPPAIKVWLAFLAYGLTDAAVAERHRDLWRRLEAALAAHLGRTGVPAELTQDAAALLLASLDGIAIARAVEPERMPLDRCRELVHRAVAVATANPRT